MSREPNYAEEMKLPDGRTCSECFASRFCIGIGCTTAESTKCDKAVRTSGRAGR
jgi:hypothetical protein